MTRATHIPIEKIEVSAFTIPTDYPEADGTYAWDQTTIVIVEAGAGGQRGLGYTYADTATAKLIQSTLAEVVQGRNVLDVPGAWEAMLRAIRNLGRPGIASMAISAVDVALWDCKARLLDLPLVSLLGGTHQDAPIYGSGGFTTYPIPKLREQLGGWVERGIPRVKMKIGTHPADDLGRVRAARAAIGPDAQLFVDANGAYSRKQALQQAEAFAALGVAWFEEPVTSDDLDGLRLLRDRAPAGIDIAAGEYGYDLWYFRRMLDAGAVDVLQIDATRAGGITGFIRAAALAEAQSLPVSAHCAPMLHLAPMCHVALTRPMEYFHDHVRIERLLFEGVVEPVDGALTPDRSRPGLGIELKRSEAQRFAA
ncbi:MAG TPA: enolase C-terminal domain-like protein [Ktedonobacterales bacterium]